MSPTVSNAYTTPSSRGLGRPCPARAHTGLRFQVHLSPLASSSSPLHATTQNSFPRLRTSTRQPPSSTVHTANPSITRNQLRIFVAGHLCTVTSRKRTARLPRSPSTSSPRSHPALPPSAHRPAPPSRCHRQARQDFRPKQPRDNHHSLRSEKHQTHTWYNEHTAVYVSARQERRHQTLLPPLQAAPVSYSPDAVPQYQYISRLISHRPEEFMTSHQNERSNPRLPHVNPKIS